MCTRLTQLLIFGFPSLHNTWKELIEEIQYAVITQTNLLQKVPMFYFISSLLHYATIQLLQV